MAYGRSAFAPQEFTGSQNVAAKRPQSGFWRRLFDAMAVARRRQAEREIERYLRDIGGKLTDEAEREIEARFLSMPLR
jgi:hypothetical protein